MLTGRFGGTTGRPYVEGRVYFPRLGVNGHVSFLVDTGADTSLLSPVDAIRIGLDFSRIARRGEAEGIGGSVTTYVEQAVVVFSEPGVGIWGYTGDLEILPPEDDDYEVDADDPEEFVRLPSLLGREILDRWKITYDPFNDLVCFEVRSSDSFLDMSKSGE